MDLLLNDNQVKQIQELYNNGKLSKEQIIDVFYKSTIGRNLSLKEYNILRDRFTSYFKF